MNTVQAQVCRILQEVMQLLDDAGEQLAAIHVCQAIETLRGTTGESPAISAAAE